MNKGYVYILKSLSSGRYYIGSSTNPEKRLARHNRGRVSATKNRGAWIIVLVQEYRTVLEARRVELRLKKFKRKDIIEKIIKDGFIKLKDNRL